MELITLAIITGLADLGQAVITDAYDALKKALQRKFGVESELVEAVDKLEQKPDSQAYHCSLYRVNSISKWYSR